ncbi:MAG: tRNA 2-thiouridine(34) synthase MnmA [Bdellovibrionales bacterium]
MNSKKRKRVLVAMSGGVDSSAAAALLVDQGYDVVGATMQVWDYSSCDVTEGNGTCCSSLDVEDARSVADELEIPFYVLNCEAKFKSSVIDPFLKDYLDGKTPLPCVNCNTYLKFDHLIKKMHELDCDYLATGHYAQVRYDELGQAGIYTSTDDWKDQTYFLFTIDPSVVPRLLFPVGGMKKPEVREYCEKRGLRVAQKKDSTGICFVGNMGYGKFIESQVPQEILKSKSGLIKRYPSGEIMGEHSGIHHFTIGQGKGLGLTHHEKLFVIKVDVETHTVWVGSEEHLFSEQALVVDSQFISELKADEVVGVKIRYQHKPSLAQVKFNTQGQIELKFIEPQRAVTPGQAAVFYRGHQLLGGGWIKS